MCVASKYMKLRSFNKRMVVEVETTVVAGRWVSVKVPRLRSLRDYWSSL